MNDIQEFTLPPGASVNVAGEIWQTSPDFAAPRLIGFVPIVDG